MRPLILLHVLCIMAIAAPLAAVAAGAVTPPKLPAPKIATNHPGSAKYKAITVERGVTNDQAFANWAGQNSSPPPGKGNGPSKFGTITVTRGVTQDSAFGAWAGQGSSSHQ